MRDGGPRSREELRSQASAVLRKNDVGRHTVPSRALYPHQWNWDSALCALGWVELDADRAWDELESLVAARDRHGMLPHIAFRRPRWRRLGREGPVLGRYARPAGLGYLPGAPWWGPRHGLDGRAVSGITQPPLAASSLLTGELSSRVGVPSAARDPQGWSRTYWRGPVWANVTWLCARALELHGDERLARTLRQRLLDTVSAGGMREYFTSDSGRGLGARDFAWTAALTLRVLADG